MNMAVNAYLVLEGIDGPSKSRSKGIDIMSFSFGTSNSAMISTASGGELQAGKANFQDLSVMKVLDKTTPDLWAHCVKAVFVKKIEIFYDKEIAEKHEDYFKIELSDALITSIQLSGSSEHPMESLTFTYSKVKVSYNPEDDGKLAGFIDRGFDVQTLEKW
jgi:type VI secretion system secreted protein Hcp